MNTIGLVGGTGWASTLEYYRLVNEEVERRLGGYEAARCILYSLNFGDVMRAKAGDPGQAKVREMVVDAAVRLAAAGADGLALCANTLHWFAEDVERAAARPLIHVATATGTRILAEGLGCVGLLGTLPTMEREFFRERLEAMGIGVLVPEASGRRLIDRAIYEELVKRRFLAGTRQAFLDVIASLKGQGAEGVVLGCTEIPPLLAGAHCGLPLFDTLAIHASACVDFALSGARLD
jgi:aspartate racemase